MWTLFFAPAPVVDYQTATASDTARFARFFWGMMDRGVYLPCSQFEAAFLSAAMTDGQIDETILAAGEVLSEIRKALQNQPSIKAYEAAKKYVSCPTDATDAAETTRVTYLKGFIAKYEKQERFTRLTNLINEKKYVEAFKRSDFEAMLSYYKQNYPKAIEAFKKALAADPNQPEAHAYMGFILVQAGHGDGALLAFDKALAQAPNFPMALWGKAMVLYQEKKDFAGARTLLERLMSMMPPGEERNEVVKALAEIPTAGGAPQPTAAGPAGAANPAGQTISGKISVDAKLKDKVDPQAALFIIARAAVGPAGPPLAVKKIDKPIFPLSYALSQDNVMMQGRSFSGKINITARLDKDGNPTTRTPGDLTGEYKQNPAEVGTKNVDIVLDQAVP
jgi:tetratricopeptide (TPR) repeat protein